MIVAFDNTFLTLVLHPGSRPRPDPSTRTPVPYHKERIEALIDRLSKKSAQVIVPAPSFAETLCAAGEAERIVDLVRKYRVIDIVPFDAKSAFELAEMTRTAKKMGDKRSGLPKDMEWQRIKIDRQIVAVAKAHGASTLYTDDDNQAHFAKVAGLGVVHTWELDLPPEYAQVDWLRDDKD